MMEIGIKEVIKELIFGVAPLGAGVYLFEKNLIISVLLIIFGCVVISILVWNFIEREKALRRTYGYGYLK